VNDLQYFEVGIQRMSNQYGLCINQAAKGRLDVNQIDRDLISLK
jgi:hypothetical protein